MNTCQLVITVLGGLALFVYGMGLMSDGLTQIAGSRIKRILGLITCNRVAAIAAGAGVTAIIQSSSATSVMTVGFVNAGLLSLTQAIGVIFGANIGTTVTGQLVSLKLSDLALPAVIIGVIGLMAAHRTMMRGVWRTILGFGLLFYGMEMMSHELKVLSTHPGFISFFASFTCLPNGSGYLAIGPVLGAIAVGTVSTAIIQSSSATVGIIIALANTGVLNIWTAVPIVLGTNIGTTITAILASIGTNVNARRTALAHALFNLIGTILIVCTFGFVMSDVSGFRAPAFFHLVDACTEGAGFLGENPGRHVAMAHTLFNVANVIILAFFIPQLARLCTFLIPSRNDQKATLLEPHLLISPDLALQAVQNALLDMTRRSWTLVAVSLKAYQGRCTISDEQVEDVEKEIDRFQHDIREYLIAITHHKLDDVQAERIPDLFHAVNDAERLSDLAVRIYHKSLTRHESGRPVAPSVRDATSLCRDLAHKTFALLRGERIDLSLLQEKRRQVRRLATDQPAAFEDSRDVPILTALYDVARHLVNIAKRA